MADVVPIDLVCLRDIYYVSFSIAKKYVTVVDERKEKRLLFKATDVFVKAFCHFSSTFISL